MVDYELGLTRGYRLTLPQCLKKIYCSTTIECVKNHRSGEKGNPFAYVVHRDQKDPQTTSKMIEMRSTGGVRFQHTDKEFKLGE